MTLWLLGLNHQTAPVDLRERVAFAGDALGRALASLRKLPEVHEAALLSTCNRTEIYAVAADGQALAAWLDEQAEGLGAYLYQHRDADAVRHLFRVATGLDSMVLGEPQILGQVKEAWALAREHGALGGRLDRLFQQTFAVAKRARTDTRIGANPVSVASTAVRLAQDSFAHLPDSTVLLVGAGETIELAARHLAKGGVRRLLVANRTLAHAQDLATRHGGYALPLTELDRHLAEADVVFSATASREPVLRQAQVEAALNERTGQSQPELLVVVDAVDELLGSHPQVAGTLQRIADEGRDKRVRLLMSSTEPTSTFAVGARVGRPVEATSDVVIALRTATAQTSMDALGGPQAWQLPMSPPGLGYVRPRDGAITGPVRLFTAADVAPALSSRLMTI